MNDNKKSRKQLIKELSELRLEINSLKSGVVDVADNDIENGKLKALEKTLPDINRRYEELMEQIRDVIFVLSNQGIIISLNKAFERITGWGVTEWIGKPFTGLLNPEDVPIVMERISNLLKGGFNHELELRILKKTGDYVNSEILSSPQVDNGRVVGILGIGRDITERKRSEVALASERTLLRTLVDLLPAYIYVKDTESRFLLVNDACALYMGASSSQELIGKTDNDFYEPAIAKGFRSDEMKVLKDIPLFNKEEQSVSNGIHKILLTTKVPLKDSKGKIIGLVGTSIDITENKRAEESLRISEENFRALFNENPSPTILSELPSGKIAFANRRMSVLMNMEPKDIIGKTANDLGLLNDPRDLERLTKLITSQGYVDNIEIDKLYPDGQPGIDLISMRIITINGKLYCLTVVQDITERKQVEKAIIKAREKAEESDRLKSAFLANMGHEIRTPMNGIMGFSELLKNPTLTGKEQQEYVNIIEKSGARMLNIINDLIDVSKIESGQMSVNISICNIREVSEYIFSFFKPEVESKGLGFSYHSNLSANESVIITDKEKINAILVNLIKNSIKFTDRGSIEYGYNRKGKYLEFYVKDTGVGISPEHKEIIFERFRQGSESLSRSYEGAGLGLSISKSFVEMLDGKIWMESTPGEGSTFYFTIPYNTVQTEKSYPEYDKKKEMRNIDKKLKILIAEDDQASGIFLTNVLKTISSESFIVKTGIEAVKYCKTNPEIDLILMDIKMAGMDGYEATRKIRKFNKQVIIIAQTAYAQSGEKDKAIEAGCNDYISKPIMKDELMLLIHKHVKK